jgi:hypothetical protein
VSAFGAHRVRLDVNLTRYHVHLTPGVMGVSVPGRKTTDFGVSDRFWAVEYDCCGHVMDTIADNLTVIDPPGGDAL